MVLLKYCGNHCLHDVVVSSHSQANYLGFIFAKSKRVVTATEVKEWISQISVKQKLVAVFVNESINEILNVISTVPFDVIQCHGEETVEYMTELKKKIQQDLWKVIHHGPNALEQMKQYHGVVDGYVVDSKVGNQRGGTGVTFDWTHIPKYLIEAKKQEVPCFIAGGINLKTIDELLPYQPVGIDISSGIEEEGKKSKEIMKQIEERLFQ